MSEDKCFAPVIAKSVAASSILCKVLVLWKLFVLEDPSVSFFSHLRGHVHADQVLLVLIMVVCSMFSYSILVVHSTSRSCALPNQICVTKLQSIKKVAYRLLDVHMQFWIASHSKNLHYEVPSLYNLSS